MNIRESENKLFDKWQKERAYEFFVKDGIFNTAQWEKEALKITFVLKEANWMGESVNLIEWIMSEQSPTYWKTWNNIARWTKAILQGGDYPEHVSKSDKTYWLSKVSFLNLKKVGGGSVADDKVIQEFAQNDSSYIMEQLNLYKPHIIICCGRGDGKNADLLYENVFPKEALSKWHTTSNGFNYFFVKFDGNKQHTPVVSYYHPQRIAGHELFSKWYEDMKTIAKEVFCFT